MTRAFNLLMFLMLSLWLTACGGGGGSAGTPSGSASPANFQVLAPSTVSAAIGQKLSYPISGGTAPYKVKVENPNVLVAQINGSLVEISLLAEGSSAITVSTSDVISGSVSAVPSYTFTVSVSSSVSSLTVQVPTGVLTLAKGVTAKYAVSGGTGPYTVVSSNQSVAAGQIVGGNLQVNALRVGETTLTVVDYFNKRVDIPVAVVAASSASSLVVQVPTGTVTLATGVKAQYAVSGGSAPYAVLTSNPSVAVGQIVGTNLHVTALRPGEVTISVVDDLNSREDIKFSVVTATPFVTNAPSSLRLARGATATYSLSGGIAPYSVTAPDDPAVMDVVLAGDSLTFVGKKAGLAVVKLKDAGGGELSVSVTVTSIPLGLSAGVAVKVGLGTSNTFAVVGGRAPYSVASQSPVVLTASVSGSTLTLIAANPSQLGSFPRDVIVRLTDADGTTADVNVELFTDGSKTLGLSAGNAVRVALGTSNTFGVVGGRAPYLAASQSPSVLSATISGSTLSLIAVKQTQLGTFPSSVTVRLTDADGATADVNVALFVEGNNFTLDVGNAVTIPLRATSDYRIVGGKAPYTASSRAPGAVTATVLGGTLRLAVFDPRGANFPTEVTVRMTDSDGLTADIVVTLFQGEFRVPFISTATGTVNLPVGEAVRYDVRGGVTPYVVGSSNEQVATATISSSQLTIQARSVGIARLTMIDAAGDALVVTVQVGQTGVLYTTAPSAITLNGAEVRTFVIGGGNPGYIAVSSNESVAKAVVSGSSLRIEAVGNGTADITVFDSTGARVAPIAVTVTQAATALVGSIDVITDLAQIRSAGEQALITAFVKNAGNVGMANQSVVFTASSGVLLNPSATTDASGVATVRLSAGSDKFNRPITVNATVGSVTRSVTVNVVGTQIGITGSTSRQLTTPANTQTYTVSAQDSGGNPIVGGVIALTSSLGNPLSVASVSTSSNGRATFTHTANTAGGGTDVIRAVGLGTEFTLNVNISPIDFTVSIPDPQATPQPPQINIGTDQLVRVRFFEGGVAGTGNIVFSTTRGTLSAAPGFSLLGNQVPVIAGFADVIVRSTSAGPGVVTAQVPGPTSQPRAQVQVPLQFVATIPHSLVLQSALGAIPPNVAGSSTNATDIEATVRDINFNPVANVQVGFVLDADPSNGSLQSALGVTDANGKVKTQFISGPNSTATNGVAIRARVVSPVPVAPAPVPLERTVNLTVNGNSLFINIGFGNNIENVVNDLTTYSKPFSVYVTDANGSAVGGQAVTLAAIPDPVGIRAYFKGRLDWNGTIWTYAVGSPTAYCPNEDLNLNGVLDLGEDTNGDDRLTPGNIAVASPSTIVTDASGRATFNLLYGEQFAPWSMVQITARATVSGTESSRAIDFDLVGLSTDFNVETNPPAGRTSPFGVNACNVRN